jgi:GT2 family glycosyltransferase
MPVVSVVLPTRNRPELLADTLRDLAAQELAGEDVEVIVVDDGSEPPLAVPSGVRLVRHERPRGFNGGRNSGFEAARSELVCFVDDDVALPAGWLRAFVLGAADHQEAWCLGGPVRLRFEGVSPCMCTNCAALEGAWDVDLPEGPIAAGGHLMGGNMAIRKQAFTAVGPFDEGLVPYGEEFEWQDRAVAAGGVLVYLPGALLWHRRTRESMRLRKRLARLFRMGRGLAHYRRLLGKPTDRPRFARWFGHAIKRRCRSGVLCIAVESGKLVAALDFARGRGPNGR